MTRYLVDQVRLNGMTPVLAYYEPYSMRPDLSVPLIRMLSNSRPASEKRNDFGCESYAVGCWFPEFEFTHYLPTRPWRNIIDSCEVYLSVSGNILSVNLYRILDKSSISWVASGWDDDREQRVRSFPLIRRLVDKYINAHVIRYMEKKNIRKGSVLALSEYTRDKLSELSNRQCCTDVLPMPIDVLRYKPESNAVRKGRIGLVGRVDDPRKNVPLFMEVIKNCLESGTQVHGVLIGGKPDSQVLGLIKQWNLEEALEFKEYMATEEVIKELQRIDVLLVSSYQEGLCIAALEAMACGCPVVSTQCGGPAEYVLNGKTGYLCEFDANQLAEKITGIVNNRNQRAELSEGARSMVKSRYSGDYFRKIFWNVFDEKYPRIRQESG